MSPPTEKEKITMRPILCTLLVAGFLSASAPGAIAAPAPRPSQQDQDRNARITANLQREVGHVLRMLPRYTVFDDLKYRIDGDRVILEGSVTNPTLKSDAENVVKRLEAVSGVTNNIKVLPPSNNDDRIRRAVYRAIFNYGPLFKYGIEAVPSIHIIVDHGNVSLEGIADNDGDKNLAGLRARSVSGVFDVTNNLRVEKPD
jgi:hyperosmotically inducible protein